MATPAANKDEIPLADFNRTNTEGGRNPISSQAGSPTASEYCTTSNIENITPNKHGNPSSSKMAAPTAGTSSSGNKTASDDYDDEAMSRSRHRSIARLLPIADDVPVVPATGVPVKTKPVTSFSVTCAFAVVILNPIFLFSAKIDATSAYYHRSYFHEQLLTSTYFIMGALVSIPSFWLIRHLKTKGFLGVICYVACAGLWLRCEGLGTERERYQIVLLGQFLVALAHGMFAGLPHQMIVERFPETKHLLLMEIFSVIKKVGLFLSFIVPETTFLDEEATPVALTWIIRVNAGAITCFIFIIFFGVGRYKKPKDERGESNAFWKELHRTSKHMTTMIMISATAMYDGSFYAFAAITGSLIKGSSTLNWSGCVFLLASVIGSIGCSIILRCTARTKFLKIIVSGVCLVLMVLFVVFLHLRIDLAMLVIFGLLGLCYGSLNGMELNFLMTYIPERRPVITLMTYTISQVFAVILTFAGGRLLDVYGDVPYASFQAAFLLVAFCLGVYGHRKARTERTAPELPTVNSEREVTRP